MKRRVKFQIKFEVDLDMVPGRFHDEQDWVNFVVWNFEAQKHYNAKTEVVSVNVTDRK